MGKIGPFKKAERRVSSERILIYWRKMEMLFSCSTNGEERGVCVSCVFHGEAVTHAGTCLVALIISPRKILNRKIVFLISTYILVGEITNEIATLLFLHLAFN